MRCMCVLMKVSVECRISLDQFYFEVLKVIEFLPAVLGCFSASQCKMLANNNLINENKLSKCLLVDLL